MKRAWVPAAAGYTSLLIGALDILGAVNPHFRNSRFGALAGQLPGMVTTLARASTLVIGILLVMIAHALRRRKARAWRAVVILLPVGVLVGALHWRHPISAAISLLLLAVLVVTRKEFYALPDPRSRWRALGNLAALGVLDLGVGWLIVGGHASAGERFQQVLLGLVGLVDFPSDRVYYSLAALGALTAVTTLFLALRPERPAAVLSSDDEARLRSLLDRYGSRDSLGYFALRRDKSVIMSPTGKAAVAYRVVSGVMLASGDPIGDPEAWPGAIKRFMEEAARHAWVPAVIGCSEAGGEVWTRVGGLSALEIGDEAVVEVADFTLDGRAMRNVRQMVNRVSRAGYVCAIRRAADLRVKELEEIVQAADSWRGSSTERGFSMALGRFGDPDCVVATAHKDGQLRAVLQFVPWGPAGISLDLMRRDRTAEPGLNELLIVRTLQACDSLGVREVSLNFAMFRAALARGERLGAGPVLRTWRGLLVFLSRWFQIESLYRFNAKFRPIWEPRFVVYPSARDLPRIGVASLQAEAFIPSFTPLKRVWVLTHRKQGTRMVAADSS